MYFMVVCEIQEYSGSSVRFSNLSLCLFLFNFQRDLEEIQGILNTTEISLHQLTALVDCRSLHMVSREEDTDKRRHAYCRVAPCLFEKGPGSDVICCDVFTVQRRCTKPPLCSCLCSWIHLSPLITFALLNASSCPIDAGFGLVMKLAEWQVLGYRFAWEDCPSAASKFQVHTCKRALSLCFLLSLLCLTSSRQSLLLHENKGISRRIPNVLLLCCDIMGWVGFFSNLDRNALLVGQ